MNKSNNTKGFQKGKYNKKRNYQRDDSTEKEIVGERDIKGYRSAGRNDPSWYAVNSQLLQDAGKYSFNNPLGNLLNVRGSSTAIWSYPTDTTNPASKISVPGIMGLSVAPTYGYADNANAPLNVASRNIYTFIRHANSGHANYDSQNLMMYLLAMDNVYMLFNYLQRIYGVIRFYDQKNKYVPQAICTAMHVDYNDILTNIADYRYFLNACAFKMGAMVTPANMNIYRRHSWLFSSIYKDSDSSKAQLYTFTPDYVLKFVNSNDTQTASKLQAIAMSGRVIANADNSYVANPFTFATLKELFNKVLDPIYSDEDMNIMSGDILKAYGENGVFKIQQVPEDYLTVPVKNMEVLEQIHNAYCVGHPGDVTITEDATRSFLTSKPNFKSTFHSRCNRIVDFAWENPTPEDVMTGTRFSVISDSDDGTYYTYKNIGSDLITNVVVYMYAANSTGVPVLCNSSWLDSGNLISEVPENADKMTFWLSEVTRFDWAPQLNLFRRSTEGTFNQCMVVADLDNYTVLSTTDLEKLHETALLSLFDVPRVGASK